MIDIYVLSLFVRDICQTIGLGDRTSDYHYFNAIYNNNYQLFTMIKSSDIVNHYIDDYDMRW